MWIVNHFEACTASCSLLVGIVIAYIVLASQFNSLLHLITY